MDENFLIVAILLYYSASDTLDICLWRISVIQVMLSEIWLTWTSFLLKKERSNILDSFFFLIRLGVMQILTPCQTLSLSNLSFLIIHMASLVWISSNMNYKLSSIDMILLPFSPAVHYVVLHGDHRSLLLRPSGCSAAQPWLIQADLRGRTARPGYPAKDLVSSCHKHTGFMAASGTVHSLAVTEAGPGNLSHLFLKQTNVNYWI